ncbi:hypothetical protein [Mucilaginibacter sp.]|uniref:hypothetical protein n=1 Tax=Mucilaginibacter sp. TaxID=1882438 RepID=UPI00261F3DDE|nr:hypothetical protein [Mucilaginibacter sp.]MDB4920981.1 hypothetical protein [Mucilaginibacter sp.]
MIGYAKIISEKSHLFYEDWIKEISENYELFLDAAENILSLNYEGEQRILTKNQAKKTLTNELRLYVKFTNCFGNTVTTTITIVDDYLVIEDYSMDELITDEDDQNLRLFLKKRFDRLLDEKIGIGFIFDVRGYSEDYLLTPPPEWRENDNWRKLMGG